MENNQTEAPEKSARRGFLGKLDGFFGISRMSSTFRMEIIAGFTTFMSMVYILMVNASVCSEEWVGLSYGAAYIATAIGAIAGTLLMALLARMPLAQAPGIGVGAFVIYALLLRYSGLTYANCMLFTLIGGVIFLILTATGLRQKIFEAIPQAVRKAIPIGIGFFIAFIGMQQAKVIVADDSTLVKFFSISVMPNAGNSFMAWDAKNGVTGMLPAIVAFAGVIAIAVMSHKKVKGSILWGILGSAGLFYILAGIAYGCGSAGAEAYFSSITFVSPFAAFKEWGSEAVGKVFTAGFDFSGIEGGAATAVVVLLTSALSLCMIDMFNTIGTLYGTCKRGNLLDENGAPLRMKRMMFCDALATCVGSMAGTTTVTTFVESSSGVAEGGKTGFTALTAAILFIVAMFLSPIAQLIPRSAVAPALIWVGVLMMETIKDIDWAEPLEAVVAFITFVVMLLGYSIEKGIGMGIIAYVLVKVCTGKVKEIGVTTWIICALFLAMFLVT